MIEINRQKVFTLESANQLLPIIYRITEEAYKEMKWQGNRLQAVKNSNDIELQRSIETNIEEILNKWNKKVEKLGVVPNGLWVVDFDAGDGYFCWKFPETQVKFFHGYKDGFSARMLVE